MLSVSLITLASEVSYLLFEVKTFCLYFCLCTIMISVRNVRKCMLICKYLYTYRHVI